MGLEVVAGVGAGLVGGEAEERLLGCPGEVGEAVVLPVARVGEVVDAAVVAEPDCLAEVRDVVGAPVVFGVGDGVPEADELGRFCGELSECFADSLVPGEPGSDGPSQAILMMRAASHAQ